MKYSYENSSKKQNLPILPVLFCCGSLTKITVSCRTLTIKVMASSSFKLDTQRKLDFEKRIILLVRPDKICICTQKLATLTTGQDWKLVDLYIICDYSGWYWVWYNLKHCPAVCHWQSYKQTKALIFHAIYWRFPLLMPFSGIRTFLRLNCEWLTKSLGCLL